MQNRLADQYFQTRAAQTAASEDSATGAQATLAGKAQQVFAQTTNFITEHPAACLAAAVAAGLLLGIWMKRR